LCDCFLGHCFQNHICVSHFWLFSHKKSCKLSNFDKIRIGLHIGRLFQKKHLVTLRHVGGTKKNVSPSFSAKSVARLGSRSEDGSFWKFQICWS
jgi:hypothetical protein